MTIKSFKSLLFLTAILTVLSSKAADNSALVQQCSANGINYNSAVTFAKNLQAAVTKNDKNKMASLASYPFRVNKIGNGKTTTITIKNKQDFMSHYTTIFTANLKNNILGDTPTDIICNAQGASAGGGAVWFKTDKQSGHFFVINVY